MARKEGTIRTAIHHRNPFGPDRYGFLWETLARQPPGRHLDCGAFDGAVLRALHASGVIREGAGVDLNHAVVAAHVAEMPEAIELLALTPGSPLPFPDESFDSASLLDVIEHVVDPGSVVAEVGRVLRPSGLLVVTVPQRHLFTFLDTGNWKFRFPRLHRLAYTASRGRDAYRRRYVDCENGLFGDIEVGKGCHEHFTIATLAVLLREAGFAPLRFDGAGLFARVLVLFDAGTGRLFRKLLRPLAAKDASRFEATHLFAVARKNE